MCATFFDSWSAAVGLMAIGSLEVHQRKARVTRNDFEIVDITFSQQTTFFPPTNTTDQNYFSARSLCLRDIGYVIGKAMGLFYGF